MACVRWSAQCLSVGPSSLESRGAEDGRVEGRRAREGGRPS